MLGTIIKIEQNFTKNGAEYQKVTLAKGDGGETTKSVFNQLQDKWPLLKEGATLEFKMEQKGQFWNVVDITVPNLPPPVTPQVVPGAMPPESEIPKPKDDKMTKDDWERKDKTTRNSIESQVSIKCAVELASTKVIPPEKILTYAEVFRRFLEGSIMVKDEALFETLIKKHFSTDEQKED